MPNDDHVRTAPAMNLWPANALAMVSVVALQRVEVDAMLAELIDDQLPPGSNG